MIAVLSTGAYSLAQSAPINKPADVYRALEYIGDFSGGKLGDLDRVWFRLSDARRFMESHQAPFDAAVWQ
ncbi:MAG: hypothetical protein D6744_17395, partial [Planctomycetota bacterium]